METPQEHLGIFANQGRLATLAAEKPLKVVNKWVWRVTPTLNGNDTVTLKTNGEQQLIVQDKSKAASSIELNRREVAEFLADVRDGESIVFEEATLAQQGDAPTSRTIVVLTTRISK